MSTRMLIDGTHPEETRVVVTSGKRLEEYDIETSTKTQLKGNIYLAKVTRVEPSLQAAFVDFGGNRHGFLAFNEIHPDYYQIPVEDREALLAAQAELAESADAAQARIDEIDGDITGAEDEDEDNGEGTKSDEEDAEKEEADAADENDEADEDADEDSGKKGAKPARGQRKRRARQRRYAIQEVIKRRQIILVQVVKEERGNKGAALTTYLSLAGRYCVLMPNAARGGGVSRKITSATDRRRLKNLLNDLDIPAGMGVIMRTAGMERKKAEIKRDFDYLMRVWNEVRELTLESAAPSQVYEEGNLIKRTIRDLYSKEIDEVLVEGDEAYQSAKKLMRQLMPSHAKRVQPYRDEPMPLFQRYQIEDQLEAMHSPEVHLKSGGYIVINPTEALVAIDVNSGRATRERNIEETARKTNLEAAAEIALQLRLRDLAGLVVIDFIDMEESRNQRAVEKRLKEAMKNDRARIQLGRISPFGLFELSRQRLRPSLMETSSEICQVCQGLGHVRSTESNAVRVLRAIEEEGIRQRSSSVTVSISPPIALYILNHKRGALGQIEQRYNISVRIEGDDDLHTTDMQIERMSDGTVVKVDAKTGKDSAAEGEDAETAKGSGRRKRTRRRRRKNGAAVAETATETSEDAEAAADDDESDGDSDVKKAGAKSKTTKTAKQDETDEAPTKRRRRGKRGGRRRRVKKDETAVEETASATDSPVAEAEPDKVAEAEPDKVAEAEPVSEPVSKPAADNGAGDDSNGTDRAETPSLPTPAEADVITDTDEAPRRGWWQRKTG